MIVEALVIVAAIGSDGQAVSQWLTSHGLGDSVVEAWSQSRDEPGRASAMAMAIAHDLRREDDDLLVESRREQADQLLDSLELLEAAQLELEIISSSIRSRHRAQWNRKLGRSTRVIPAASRSSWSRANELIAKLKRRRGRLFDTPGSGDAAVATARRTELVAIDRIIRRAWALDGWARLLEGRAHGDAASLRRAMKSFARVLEVPVLQLNPEAASRDLRRDATVARSTVGLALALAATGRDEEALEWMELSASPEVRSSVRLDAARWHVLLAAEAGRFDVVRDVLERAGDDDPDLGVLAAIESCHHQDNAARSVVNQVVNSLAEQSDTGRLRLIGRVCELPTGVSIVSLAAAMSAWDVATASSVSPDQWAALGDQLVQAALAAGQDGVEVPATVDYLVGWAYRRGNHPEEAAAAFLGSADAGVMTEESLAMAADALSSINSNATRDTLVRALNQFPDGRWWRRHALQLARLDGRLDSRWRDRLGVIPSTDPDRGAIDAVLEALAWNQYSNTPRDHEVAVEYLHVVMPMLLDSRNAKDVAAWTPRAVAAALSLGIAGRSDADAALSYAQEFGVVESSPGLLSQRAHLRVLHGDIVAAELDAASACGLAPDSDACEAADLLVLQAVQGDTSLADLQAALRSGRRLITEDNRRSVLLRVGQVAAALAAHSPPDVSAVKTLDDVLALGMATGPLLSARAQAATNQKQWSAALQWWQRAGEQWNRDQPEWFETRLEYLTALSHVDSAAAITAVSQHLSLYPGGGPAPWGDRFESLKVLLQSGTDP